MWGRIDGAGWLVHLLLDPRRLHQLACEAENPANFRDRLRTKLQKIAGGDPPPGIWEPLPPNAGRPAQAAEMGFLTDPTTLPTSLPLTATWVAAGFQRHERPDRVGQVPQPGARPGPLRPWSGPTREHWPEQSTASGAFFLNTRKLVP